MNFKELHKKLGRQSKHCSRDLEAVKKRINSPEIDQMTTKTVLDRTKMLCTVAILEPDRLPSLIDQVITKDHVMLMEHNTKLLNELDMID